MEETRAREILQAMIAAEKMWLARTGKGEREVRKREVSMPAQPSPARSSDFSISPPSPRQPLTGSAVFPSFFGVP